MTKIKSLIDGCDISSTSLKIAYEKKLYRKLFNKSFEKNFLISKTYNSVSMIGAMTYCQKPILLFPIIANYLKKNGIFIFSHRIDLWNSQNFDNLIHNSKNFILTYKSRPLNYLPKNNDFSNKIKIRIVALTKI